MALVTDPPADLPTTNALDNIPDDLLASPPAYLTFGSTPSAMENPPKQGEVKTYLVRVRCKEEHGPIERKDGEMRYARTMVIQAIWEPGQQPPSTDENQGALFDQNGQPNVEDEDEAGDESDDAGRPEFSDLDTDDGDED